jgi:hypothetical protein
MKRVMTFALLAFGLAALTSGQGVSEASQGKQVLLPVSPASLDFGDQALQTLSKQLRVTLTNNTDRRIDISRVETGEGHWEDFEADDDPCTGIPIEAGKSCSIGVIFSPRAVGARRSYLLITYGDSDYSQRIALKGNGITPRSATP